MRCISHQTKRLLVYCAISIFSTVSYASSNKLTLNNGKPKMRIDFIGPNEVNLWRITNDGVMGGVSTSAMIITGQDGLFTGDISLDNNGGFSSVYRRIEPLHSDIKSISINVKGDGQTYQLKLIAKVDGYRVTYRHQFTTKKDVTALHHFNLTDFVATFRGRLLTNAPVLLAKNVKEVGFLMTKKTAGKFALTILDIEFNI